MYNLYIDTYLYIEIGIKLLTLYASLYFKGVVVMDKIFKLETLLNLIGENLNTLEFNDKKKFAEQLIFLFREKYSKEIKEEQRRVNYELSEMFVDGLNYATALNKDEKAASILILMGMIHTSYNEFMALLDKILTEYENSEISAEIEKAKEKDLKNMKERQLQKLADLISFFDNLN